MYDVSYELYDRKPPLFLNTLNYNLERVFLGLPHDFKGLQRLLEFEPVRDEFSWVHLARGNEVDGFGITAGGVTDGAQDSQGSDTRCCDREHDILYTQG